MSRKQLARRHFEGLCPSGIVQRGVLFLVLMLLGHVAMSPELAAQEPCADLSDEKNKIYVNLSMNALKDYQAEDYERAAEKIRKAIRICSEDPNVEYNLARAYHRLGTCSMALFHYRELLGSDIDRKLRKKVEKHVGDVEEECGDAVEFTFTCTDEESSLEIGELFSGVACPFSGMVVSGSYEISVSKPEHVSYTETVELHSGEANAYQFPALLRADQLGELEVTCDEGVALFSIQGPEGINEFPCPWTGQLLAGSYKVRAEGSEEAVAASVVAEQHNTVRLSVITSPFARPGVVLAAKLAPGTGFASGDLYEDGEATGESVSSLSHISFAFLLEGGYAFDEAWAVLARLRLDQSLGFLGGVMARWAPWYKNDLAFRVDMGVAAGVLKQPVFLTDGRVPVTEPSPFFLLGGAGVAYALDDMWALVGGLQLNLGVNDTLTLQVDLGLGVEMKL